MRRFIQVTDKPRRMWDSEHFPCSLSKDLNICMTPHGPSPAISRPCACWSDHQLAPWAHLKTPKAERERWGEEGSGRDTKGAQPRITPAEKGQEGTEPGLGGHTGHN